MASPWQAVCVMLLILAVVNLQYGWAGTFTRLDQLTFCSDLLSGDLTSIHPRGNRFSGTVAGSLRVPLPVDLIRGLDRQMAEFDQKKRSYLAGQWKVGGWWYYYLVTAIAKIPLAFWCLLLLRGINRGRFRQRDSQSACSTARHANDGQSLLFTGVIAVACLVSSQTGFSRHFRYAFPCLPLLYILGSQAVDRSGWRCRTVIALLLVWYVGSSLSVWPQSHSYFNELFGGPTHGHRMLVDSNLDWGEDLHYANRWRRSHPEAQPLYYAFVTDDFAAHLTPDWKPVPDPPSPGWYLASIHRICDPMDECHFLSRLEPRERIAYSTWVYHVTQDMLPLVLRSGNNRPLHQSNNAPVATSHVFAPHRCLRREIRAAEIDASWPQN